MKKIELTGTVRSFADGWMFETVIDGKPYIFGKDDKFNSSIPIALDEIFDKFNQPLTESGQAVRITIER